MTKANVTLSTQQLADHDLLVTGIEKLNQLSLDVKEIKDNFSSRVAALEAKTQHYDKIFAEASPIKLQTIAFQNQKNIASIKSAYKLVVGGSIIISSIITYILTNLKLFSGIIK